jgi:hypothetical protein
LALTLDHHGVILAAEAVEADSRVAIEGLIGQPWQETVGVSSRVKISKLLADARQGRHARFREVNQQYPDGSSQLLEVTAVSSPDSEQLFIIGRNLATVHAMQQRLLEMQRQTTRELWYVRDNMASYSSLLNAIDCPTMVIDRHSMEVLQANDLALANADLLLPQTTNGQSLVGEGRSLHWDETQRSKLEAVFARNADVGTAPTVVLELGASRKRWIVRVKALNLHASDLWVVQLRSVATAPLEMANREDAMRSC